MDDDIDIVIPGTLGLMADKEYVDIVEAETTQRRA